MSARSSDSGRDIGVLAASSSGRKRVREGNGTTPDSMHTEEASMKDASADEDDYIDVDMDQQHSYEELEEAVESQSIRSHPPSLPHVPFYPHLGADDFDDEYVLQSCLHTRSK